MHCTYFQRLILQYLASSLNDPINDLHLRITHKLGDLWSLVKHRNRVMNFFCSDRVFRVKYLEDAIWYDHRSRLEYVNSLKLPNKTCGHNTGVNSRLIGLVEYCGVGISPRIWFCGDALIEVGKGPLAMADSDRAPLYYSASLIQCWQITVFAFEIY